MRLQFLDKPDTAISLIISDKLQNALLRILVRSFKTAGLYLSATSK